MQEEHANELRSMREETNATMHDAVRNNFSTGAKHLEEKQSTQAQFAVLSRNAHEEKQIAIARLSAKLYARDNEIFAFQEFRDKYRQMMRESSSHKRTSEPVTPPVLQPMGILPAGVHPAGINRFKEPPNSSDLDSPASDSGP